MKKTILISLLLLIGFVVTGCGVKYRSGEVRSLYEPIKVDNVEKNQGALIKVVQNFIINRVDNRSIPGDFSMENRFNQNVYSLIVKEGKHSIWAKLYLSGYYPQNAYFNDVEYKANHEYIIDYFVANHRVYYWVKDVTDNKVVYGTEKTEKDFEES